MTAASTPVTSDADGDDTDTTDGDADDTDATTRPTQTTPTRTTPSSLALDRALAPVESETFLARALGADAARRTALGGGPFRRPPLRPGRRAADHRDRDQDARVSRRQGGRDGLGLHDRPGLAAGAFHRRRRRAPRARRVRGGRDDRPAGPPPQLAAARPLLPASGSVPRPPRAGERVLHAARLAGASRSPRHARGDLAPGRGREALARLRARAGAAAEEPALPLRARRTRRAGARRDPARRATRCTCRAAGSTRR